MRTFRALVVLILTTLAARSGAFEGIGALPPALLHSGHPYIATPTGRPLVGRACASTYFTGNCSPFIHAPPLANAALDPVAGDDTASAWDATPNASIVVGLSQDAASSHRGRVAVMWANGAAPVPLATHSESNATWAKHVSDDGTVVAGSWIFVYDETAFVWTQATGALQLLEPSLPLLDHSRAVGLSNAGEAALNLAGDLPFYGESARAARWTVAGGLEVLGALPPGFASSSAAAIAASSGDIAGTVWSGDAGSSSGRAYRWTEGAGIELLPLPAPHIESSAALVSVDGSTILGSFVNAAPSDLEREGFRWTSATGAMSMGAAPGFSETVATGLTTGGELVWGELDWRETQLVFEGTNTWDVWEERVEHQAFIWSGAGPRIDLPHAATTLFATCDHDLSTRVSSASIDASVVIVRGRCTESVTFNEFYEPEGGYWDVYRSGGARLEAYFVWDAVNGLRTVEQFLELEEAVGLAGWEITSADVSEDGTILLGGGIHDGRSEGWVHTVPEPGVVRALVSTMWLLGFLARLRSRRR